MLAFTPFLMRGDFDPLQIAIVVLFLIGSFVKWLWENWQAKRGGGVPADFESESLREDAQQRGGPPALPPLTPAAPSPLDEWRRAWKEIQDAARPAQPSPPPARRPAVPPPLRQQGRPGMSAAQTAPVPAQPTTSPVTTPPPQAAVSPQVGGTANTSLLHALQQLRRDPALMRQAILMREVLGPPKALQTSADPAI